MFYPKQENRNFSIYSPKPFRTRISKKPHLFRNHIFFLNRLDQNLIIDLFGVFLNLIGFYYLITCVQVNVAIERQATEDEQRV